jgi:hypothetical protein
MIARYSCLNIYCKLMPYCCVMLPYLAEQNGCNYIFMELFGLDFRSRTWCLYLLHVVKNYPIHKNSMVVWVLTGCYFYFTVNRLLYSDFLSFPDVLLMSYSIIVLDEAHERTVHTDVLFGIAKQAQTLRKEKHLKPLKVRECINNLIYVWICI